MLTRFPPALLPAWRGDWRWLAILAWLGFAPALAAGPSAGIPEARDLSADGRIASASRQPLVLLFTRGECPWCERVRREYLLPISRDENSRVLVREVDIDRPRSLVDFDGRRTTSADFSRRHQVRLAPTLMFFDGAGRQAAEPIVGFRLADFYGAYLERAIDDSRTAIARRHP